MKSTLFLAIHHLHIHNEYIVLGAKVCFSFLILTQKTKTPIY